MPLRMFNFYPLTVLPSSSTNNDVSSSYSSRLAGYKSNILKLLGFNVPDYRAYLDGLTTSVQLGKKGTWREQLNALTSFFRASSFEEIRKPKPELLKLNVLYMAGLVLVMSTLLLSRNRKGIYALCNSVWLLSIRLPVPTSISWFRFSNKRAQTAPLVGATKKPLPLDVTKLPLPDGSYDENHNCSTCFETLKHPYTLQPCSHHLCALCCYQLLVKQKPKCPECRATIVSAIYNSTYDDQLYSLWKESDGSELRHAWLNVVKFVGRIAGGKVEEWNGMKGEEGRKREKWEGRWAECYYGVEGPVRDIMEAVEDGLVREHNKERKKKEGVWGKWW